MNKETVEEMVDRSLRDETSVERHELIKIRDRLSYLYREMKALNKQTIEDEVKMKELRRERNVYKNSWEYMCNKAMKDDGIK